MKGDVGGRVRHGAKSAGTAGAEFGTAGGARAEGEPREAAGPGSARPSLPASLRRSVPGGLPSLPAGACFRSGCHQWHKKPQLKRGPLRLFIRTPRALASPRQPAATWPAPAPLAGGHRALPSASLNQRPPAPGTCAAAAREPPPHTHRPPANHRRTASKNTAQNRTPNSHKAKQTQNAALRVSRTCLNGRWRSPPGEARWQPGAFPPWPP